MLKRSADSSTLEPTPKRLKTQENAEDPQDELSIKRRVRRAIPATPLPPASYPLSLPQIEENRRQALERKRQREEERRKKAAAASGWQEAHVKPMKTTSITSYFAVTPPKTPTSDTTAKYYTIISICPSHCRSLTPLKMASLGTSPLNSLTSSSQSPSPPSPLQPMRRRPAHQAGPPMRQELLRHEQTPVIAAPELNVTSVEQKPTLLKLNAMRLEVVRAFTYVSVILISTGVTVIVRRLSAPSGGRALQQGLSRLPRAARAECRPSTIGPISSRTNLLEVLLNLPFCLNTHIEIRCKRETAGSRRLRPIDTAHHA